VGGRCESSAGAVAAGGNASVRAIRIGICILVVFAVLAFGTVEIWSESILEAGAAGLFLWWAVLVFRQREIEIRWNAIFWPLLAFLGIATGQLVFRGTIYPFLTRVALLKILACALLFFLTVQAFRTRSDLKLLAWFLMGFGFCVAVLGIAQNYTSHDVIYWFRPLTEGGNPFGPYVDCDHFAGFMELIVPVGMSLVAFRGVREEQIVFAGVLTLVPIIALVLTASRGGIVSLVFELGLLAVLMRERKTRFQGVALVVILLIALASLGWLGAGKVLDRITSSHVGGLSADRRVTMLRGAWHIFVDHPVAGTGLGTLVAAYPKYETLYDGKIVDHVHDDYAEALAETGVTGGLCGVIFLVMLFRESKRRLTEEQSTFSRAIHVAGTVGCAGLLVHSFVDFNLHIPANGLIFLVQAAIILSPTFRRRRQPVIT
jgi:O-antigen ligase